MNKRNKHQRLTGRLLLCVVMGMFLLLTGCGAGQEKSGVSDVSGSPAPAQKAEERVYTPAQISSLEEYAKRLEENGNPEAAAAVYALVPGYHGEFAAKVRSEAPAIMMSDELGELNIILAHAGGDAK